MAILMVDEHSMIWDGGKPVGVWDVKWGKQWQLSRNPDAPPECSIVRKAARASKSPNGSAFAFGDALGVAQAAEMQ